MKRIAISLIILIALICSCKRNKENEVYKATIEHGNLDDFNLTFKYKRTYQWDNFIQRNKLVKKEEGEYIILSLGKTVRISENSKNRSEVEYLKKFANMTEIVFTKGEDDPFLWYSAMYNKVEIHIPYDYKNKVPRKFIVYSNSEDDQINKLEEYH
jgi:hypothetical protein